MQEEHAQQFSQEQIRMSQQQASDKIALGEALERLTNNEDWKKVILTELMEKEPQRLIFLKADPSMSDERMQKILDEEIMMIGNFRQFCRRVMKEAEMSRKALEDYRQLEDELREAQDDEFDDE